jgi:polysaccharide export outer membrane protein
MRCPLAANLRLPSGIVRAWPLLLILAAWTAAAGDAAAQTTLPPTTPPLPVIDATEHKRNFIYRLSLGDRIRVAVFQEEELSAIPRVDARGRVSLPLVGEVEVAGLTLTEAQARIEAAFRDGRFLRAPQVNIVVEEYAPREISVLGQVRNPGKFALPVESTLTVVEAVTRAGGFTDIARGSAVRVTRIGPDGKETNFDVDVDSVIRGRGRGRIEDNSLLLEAGDIVFVPERLI